MTTWHKANGCRAQGILKRPYYKGGSFPLGQWKGLGHILPWPWVGSEWGKERQESQTPFPMLLTMCSLQDICCSSNQTAQCCGPFRGCTTRVFGRQKCVCISLPMVGPQGCAYIHTTHLPSCCLGPLLTFHPPFPNGMAGREQSSQGHYSVKQTTLYFLL